MRAIFIAIFFGAFLFLGCSKDELNETNEEVSSTTLKKQKAGALAVDFKFKENGIFKIPNSYYCYGGEFIESSGFIHEKLLGKFYTLYQQCTDSSGIMYVEANFTDMQGDVIYFYADEPELINDEEMIIKAEAIGGTGKYSNISGVIKITNKKKYEHADYGTYVNVSEGTLAY